jgi:hypothetical protein
LLSFGKTWVVEDKLGKGKSPSKVCWTDGCAHLYFGKTLCERRILRSSRQNGFYYTENTASLLVITIPPTEYIHETTKELKTPKRTFTEHTVFMRRDESIVIASASDRAVLRRAKQKFFDEREDVPPTKFGAGLGALLLAPITLEKPKKELGYGPAGQLYAIILGGLIGALVGGMVGNGYKDYRHVAREWPVLSPEQRTIFVSVTAVIATLVMTIWRKLFGQRSATG